MYNGFRAKVSTKKPEKGRINNAAIVYDDKIIPTIDLPAANSFPKYIGKIGRNK